MAGGRYRLDLKRSAARFFEDERVPVDVKVRARNAIAELLESPRRGDRHLKGRYYCFWRRRVGDYRIIYRVSDSERTVTVVEICHRSRCY